MTLKLALLHLLVVPSAALRLASQRQPVTAKENAFASNRFSKEVDWNDIVKKTNQLTVGEWRPDITFASSLSYGDSLDLSTCLAGKSIFIVGDSWAREKYKTLIHLLSKESGEPVKSDDYILGEKPLVPQRMRHTGEDVDPHKTGCTFGWEKFSKSCPGIDLKLCGRPGSDSYTFYEGDKKMSWDSPGRKISLHFQFKTYMLTPSADKLLYDDIARINPDIVIVDVGRWGPTPGFCLSASEEEKEGRHVHMNTRDEESDQYVTFLTRLNATTEKPIFIFDSGEENKDEFNWLQHDDEVKLVMKRSHMPFFKIDDILNNDALKQVDCTSTNTAKKKKKSIKPKTSEIQFDELTKQDHSASSMVPLASAKACPKRHGFVGDLMDEVVRLSMRHIYHLTHDVQQ